MAQPFRQQVKSASDLETTREAYRAGFIALALERNHRATPFVERARTALSRINEAFARNQVRPTRSSSAPP